MKKRLVANICIVVLLLLAINWGYSLVIEKNCNPLQRLVSIEENEKSVSTIRIFRNVFTGRLYLNVRSYYKEVSYTELVNEDGTPIYWELGKNYEDRFDLVFALYSDDSGGTYQRLVDKETHVVYSFYLTGDYRVLLETTADGSPLQWEGEVPSYENLLA